MLEIGLLFKKFTNLQENKQTILRIKNAKFSGYCSYINTNIQLQENCLLKLNTENLTSFYDAISDSDLTTEEFETDFKS